MGWWYSRSGYVCCSLCSASIGGGSTTRQELEVRLNAILRRMEIPMLKIRRSWDRLIFYMGIPILVRHLYIETAPKIQDSRFKSIYSTMYRHQSYKTMEQCEKTNQNISWWVHVWRPSLRPFGRYHKGHQKMFGSTGRIKVSRYDSNNNNKKKRRLMPKGINAVTMPSGE